VLNHEAWKTLPWTNREKPSEDILLDVLVELPEILEGLDKLDPEPREGNQLQGLCLEVLGKCRSAHEHLEAWVDNYPEEVYTPEKDEPIPIAFPNLGIALLSIHYWATAVLFYDSRPHARLFAHHILRSVPYLFEEENGFPGAAAVSFPLGVALNYMRQNVVQEPRYTNIVYRSWSRPKLPSTIKIFLTSMRSATDAAARSAPVKRIK
jgi:hypothetical protein